MSVPGPSFVHLRHLSDEVGVFEHAWGTEPRRRGGYCADDVGRALLAVVREPACHAPLVRLAETYLAFLVRAQRPDGGFRNRRAWKPAGHWLDSLGSDDANGRALRGLAAAAALASSPGLRATALACFERAAGFASPWPRANAAAALAAVDVLSVHPGHRPALGLLERAAAGLGSPGPTPAWPWPEPRLAYENAILAEARIAAGAALGRPALLDEGLALLGWLVSTETRRDRFSFAPVGGWAPGEPRPGFDQQPIEAGAMACACARAHAVTGDPAWADTALRAAEWFLGRNDVGVPLLDPVSGGCHDGLEPDGCNENEGAESTLALIAALQAAAPLQAAARGARRSADSSTTAAPT